MSNLFDYLQTQFATFNDEPFNGVDAAILSQFCMVRGCGIIPEIPLERENPPKKGSLAHTLRSFLPRKFQKKAPSGDPVGFDDLLRAELFPDMFAGLHPQKARELLFFLAASPRFRHLKICHYADYFDQQRQAQFAAVTLFLPDGFTCVCFRGTDATLTGWREDFDMSFEAPVPAQQCALRYLEEVAADKRLPEKLFVLGHSKGGNLAEYAALKASADIQARIERLYSMDGPGFPQGMFTAEDYAPLAGRLTKYEPQDDMIGMLMTSLMPVTVVCSEGEGINQHSPFLWEINSDNTGFLTLPEPPQKTKLREQVVHTWFATLDKGQRAQLTEALFETLKAVGVETAADVFGAPSMIALVRKGLAKTDAESRATLLNAMNGIRVARKEVLKADRSAQRS